MIHAKREEIRPKRVGNDFGRDCTPRGESLFTKAIQPLNPPTQTPVKKRFLVTRNTLDQRVTYFGMNFTAGCGKASMEDPMMKFAMLQVRTVRM